MELSGCVAQKVISRGSRDHKNLRVLHTGSKAQDKKDFRNHGLQDPYSLMWSLTDVRSERRRRAKGR